MGGTLRGEGVSVGTPQRAATPYVAVGARIGLEWGVSQGLAVRLHTDLLAPVTPTTLSDRDQEVWTTPAISAAAGVGLLGRF